MRAFGVGAFLLSLFALVGTTARIERLKAQRPDGAAVSVPKTWDDAAMAMLEVPLANPIGSPKHVSASYYYKIPVNPIYKQYPVYAPGHEPSGYMDWLKQQEPQIIWDDKGHAAPLRSEADWIKAGELVFDAQITYVGEHGGLFTLSETADRRWYEKTGMPVLKDGRLPFLNYVIRKKGNVELGSFACAMCHTRIVADGSILKGAQGSFPFDRAMAFTYATELAAHPEFAHSNEQQLYAAPWLRPEPLQLEEGMSSQQMAEIHEGVPPGVISRHRSSPFYPVQVPDLIGVKDRRYLDRTGLQQHRGIVDLMRYAALNQGADDLASYDGFIPADFPNFRKLPDPADPDRVGGRYSDEQLYALALYVYSLKPPPNPNRFDAVAAQGQKIFEREGCAMCHTPPLYTNNKLTLAEGFTPPPGAEQKYEIMPISVGTDPNLALKTRRGTGYYKVPSLKGVWYRSMFGHSGWCATLEDWFDPRRLRDDYAPTGFKPYGVKTYAVKGHPFGLDLNAADKKALIAFLKTL
ncbi:MAG: hypothetical protein ACRD3D_11210 [Terriglobia bacterium]